MILRRPIAIAREHVRVGSDAIEIRFRNDGGWFLLAALHPSEPHDTRLRAEALTHAIAYAIRRDRAQRRKKR